MDMNKSIGRSHAGWRKENKNDKKSGNLKYQLIQFIAVVVLIFVVSFAATYIEQGGITHESLKLFVILIVVIGGLTLLVTLNAFIQSFRWNKTNIILKEFASKTGLEFKSIEHHFLLNSGFCGPVGGNYQGYNINISVHNQPIILGRGNDMCIKLNNKSNSKTIFIKYFSFGERIDSLLRPKNELLTGLVGSVPPSKIPSKEVTFDSNEFNRNYKVFSVDEAFTKKIVNHDVMYRLNRAKCHIFVDSSGICYASGIPKNINQIEDALILLIELASKIQKYS